MAQYEFQVVEQAGGRVSHLNERLQQLVAEGWEPIFMTGAAPQVSVMMRRPATAPQAAAPRPASAAQATPPGGQRPAAAPGQPARPAPAPGVAPQAPRPAGPPAGQQ